MPVSRVLFDRLITESQFSHVVWCADSEMRMRNIKLRELLASVEIELAWLGYDAHRYSNLAV